MEKKEGWEQIPGKKEGDKKVGATVQVLMALLIFAIVFTTFLLGVLLDRALTAAVGVKPVLHLPLLGRAFGALLIFLGCLVLGDTFRYRNPRDILASTSVTLVKLLTKQPLAERGGRTEPFVPKGPYRWVRNPMYFAVVVFPFGLGVLLSSATLFLWGIVLVCWFMVLIPREEKELEALFGDSYKEYRRQVPMLLPTGRRFRSADDQGSFIAA